MSRFSHENEWDFYPTRAFQSRFGKAGTLASLEGGKGDTPAPPPPDPAIGRAAEAQSSIAAQQQAVYNNVILPRMLKQTDMALDIAKDQNVRDTAMQEYQLGRTKTFDNRWDKTQVPLEDEIVRTARDYNEPAERERLAGDAGADVNTAFAASDAMMERDLASRGVNPNSGNYVAMRNQNAVQRAGAASAAMNKTRQAAKDIGWTRLGESAALGRGLPGFGATSAQLSLGAGQAAFSAGTAGVGLVGTASATNNAGYGAGGGLYAGSGQTANAGYSAQMSGYGIQTGAQTAANGQFGQVLGTAVGVGAAVF